MRIKIAQRFYPFSHTPGVLCLLPGTPILLRVFPSRLEIYNAISWPVEYVSSITLPVRGPVKNFSVQQDLEHGFVKVWGHSLEGYFCYKVMPEVPGPVVVYEKQPDSWNKDDLEFSVDYPVVERSNQERLSLGNHKKQDWDLVCRRDDLTEILPIWLRLAEYSPPVEENTEEGVASLIIQAAEIIKKREKLDVVSALRNIFLSGFHGIMVPRLEDDQYQGIVDADPISTKASPLQIITRGADLIESLFVQQNEIVEILPCLPPQFHCGRLTGVSCGDLGNLDMEWSKKIIKKIIFHALSDGILKLRFQKGVKTLRLRESLRERGRRISCGSDIEIFSGKTYFLDNFQK